jgi:DNA topoisomerase-2
MTSRTSKQTVVVIDPSLDEEVEGHIRQERSEEDYNEFTDTEHVYNKPETYLSTTERFIREDWVFNPEEEILFKSNIEIPEAMIRIFLEIASNASDNADSSRRFINPIDPGGIHVHLDKEYCVIRSEGEPIPVIPKQERCTSNECFTLIDWIFGVLRTSSNYSEKVIRMGCGTNGFGAKLVNIFSKYFQVKVGDPKRGQEHCSIWENNMKTKVSSQSSPGFRYEPTLGHTKKIKNEDGTSKEIFVLGTWVPITENPYTGPAYVEITYKLDFRRFGYTEYPDEALGIYSRSLIDFGLTCKIPVWFNEKCLDYRDIYKYAKLLFSEETLNTALLHYEWYSWKKVTNKTKNQTKYIVNDDNVVPKNLKKLNNEDFRQKINECTSSEYIPTLEILVLDTPDEAVQISFANGLMTRDGGVHVEEVIKVLSTVIMEKIDKVLSSRTGKGKDVIIKDGSKHLTIKDIRQHFSVIVNYRCPDPKHTSQSKTKLESPKPLVTVPPDFEKLLDSWQIIDRCIDIITYKINGTSKSKREKVVVVEKGEDANRAGTNESDRCLLYLVEGDSASSYSSKRLCQMPNEGRDYAGYVPLKGKPINVSGADLAKIKKNEEIENIIKLINLETNVDYSIKENKDKLRYGFILSTVDADSDGKHINALLLNLFYKQYPSILRIGMFGMLVIPMIKMFNSSGKCKQRFYTDNEYKKYINENPNHGLTTRYFKGLASSTDEDIEYDLDTAPTLICVFDDTAGESLDLAFDKNNADLRKNWIENWRNFSRVDDIIPVGISKLLKKRDITSIINTDLIDYTVDSLFRALPSQNDGLKKSQRQILFYMLDKWNYGTSKASTKKVSDIASGASEKLHYHHGAVSLENTLIKMSQSFVGSNNMNFFEKVGQFGTRNKMGKDAGSGRYIQAGLEWWIKYVYSEELTSLVDLRNVEGDLAEPHFIPSNLPMHVINGTLGIATAFSNFICAHNPYDVIEWLIERNSGNLSPKELKAWYRSYGGTLEVVDRELPKGPKVRRVQSLNELITGVQSSNEFQTEDIEPETEPEDLKKEDEPEDEENFENIADKIGYNDYRNIAGKSLKSTGSFEIIKQNSNGTVDVRITELPLFKAIFSYRKEMEAKIKTKHVKNVERFGKKVDDIDIVIYGWNHPKGANIQTLKLERSFGITNMTLIDDDGYPTIYRNVQQVMEVYYKNMIEIYNKLIIRRIESIEHEIENLTHHYNLVILINNGTIKLLDSNGKFFSKELLRREATMHNIPTKYMDKIKIYDCTEEEVIETYNEIKKLHERLERTKLSKAEDLWIDKLKIIRDKLKAKKYA